MTSTQVPVTQAEYVALAQFRYGLRRFLRFSEAAARAHGLTPQQHQLLLAIKGFPGRQWATVNELAERLQLQQHSVVGIVDRSEHASLVFRVSHAEDLRVTEVHLTPDGERILESLTVTHREELKRTGEFIQTFLRLQSAIEDNDLAPVKEGGENHIVVEPWEFAGL
jgi:DNA-binding MarR family transcriptional regulator